MVVNTKLLQETLSRKFAVIYTLLYVFESHWKSKSLNVKVILVYLLMTYLLMTFCSLEKNNTQSRLSNACKDHLLIWDDKIFEVYNWLPFAKQAPFCWSVYQQLSSRQLVSITKKLSIVMSSNLFTQKTDLWDYKIMNSFMMEVSII